MHRYPRSTTCFLPLLMFFLLLASTALVQHAEPDATDEGASGRNGELRLEVDQSERELYVFLDEKLVETYPVAIGQPTHPTPTGAFEIYQADWNPDWTPPDSPWAEGREYKEPGEPGNPMGRVRLLYMPPYTIHGTEDLESLGEAASHGSIRMANDDIVELAKRIMQHGDAERPDWWFDETLDTPTEMRQVELASPIPLYISE